MAITIAQLLEQVGCENVTLQDLKASATGARTKRGATEISFLTDKVNTNFVLSDRDGMTGLVLWVKTSQLKEAGKVLEEREKLTTQPKSGEEN